MNLLSDKLCLLGMYVEGKQRYVLAAKNSSNAIYGSKWGVHQPHLRVGGDLQLQVLGDNEKN